MFRVIFPFLSLFWSLTSCNGIINSKLPKEENLDKEPLWESEMLSIYKPGSLNTGPPSLYIIPIYNGIIMTGYSPDDSEKFFIGLDIKTGKRVWTGDYKTWDLSNVPKGFQFQDGEYLYFYNREILVAGGVVEYPFFKFNLSTGKLIYRKIFPENIEGNPNVLKQQNGIMVSLEPYWKDPESGLLENRFWINNVDNIDGRLTLFVPRTNNNMVAVADQGKIGARIQDFVLVQDNGDIFLVYVLNESNTWDLNKTEKKEDYVYNINCYNITKQEWVYKNKPCDAGEVTIIKDGDIIYCGSSGYPDELRPIGLYAYYWKTGELKWESKPSEFDPNPGLPFSPHSIAYNNGTIVFSSVSFMYGVDAQTGKVKWKRSGIGNTGSDFVFHHGVTYATSADGFLHGWEVETGKPLLQAKCPSKGKIYNGDSVPGFRSDIGLYVDKETDKGILVVRNFMFEYAFEAVR